ncbi:hypothetical protein J8Z24_21250 (plasmid) [Pseudoalteromonas sp. SCSIO 43201]|uniref:hypothetical protein n=1 Tax=Pseudoalteromonas sp. SCSIO 43201 TaxID=2822842 RepID=UPI002074BEA0|nr:hypothetical protein [Pseudoalteromonas sp. SCSIO 43201]USD31144.1 hypothetical protein J8Z24_21250 [Pseudoalteromonas sp. SCSIO 43201]
MSLVIHPVVLIAAENRTHYAQLSIHESSRDIHLTRKIEYKPALLIVVDAQNNVLASTVGTTYWSTKERSNLSPSQHGVNFTYRTSNADAVTAFSQTVNLQPLTPALRFTPYQDFDVALRNSGTIANAYLITDRNEQYSRIDIETWPSEMWRGDEPFDVTASGYKYLELTVGTEQSDATLRFSSLDVDQNDQVIKLIEPHINVYFTNFLRDWSNAKAELEARLNSIESVSTTQSPQEMLDAGL